MKRLTILGAAILLSLVLSLSTAVSTSSQAVLGRYPTYTTTDYSYYHWREISSRGHPFPPACTLPSVEAGDTETNGPVVCKENGLKPTPDELIEWSSYTIWDSCYQYNQRDACEELNN